MSNLFAKKLYVLDGPFGTQAQLRGMKSSDNTALWALEHPELTAEIQKSYIKAGADMLYVPSFGAIEPNLKRYKSEKSVHDINYELVKLTRQNAGKCLIGGDIAPSGLQLAPLGNTSFDTLVEIFTEQAAALEDGGVDFYAIETQMSLAEARAAIIAVRSVSEKPVLVTFTCDKIGRTIMGEDLCSALISLQDMGADAFGINCCGSPGLINRMLKKLKSKSEVPLVVKPNAGNPIESGGRVRYSMSSSKLSAAIPHFLESGARMIGGCCGTDAEFISSIKEQFSTLQKEKFTPAESGLLVASAYRVVELTPRIKIQEIEINDDIVENSTLAEEMGCKVLKLQIRDDTDLETLCEAQIAIRLPIIVSCNDGELLNRFIYLYNGKPIILNFSTNTLTKE